MRIILLEEFSGLHPLMQGLQGSEYIRGFLHRPLLQISPRGELQSSLLTEIPDPGSLQPPSGPDPSPFDIELTLHQRATWGDGVPITGHDVLFTWGVMQNNLQNLYPTSPFANISRITVNQENPKRFTIRFQERRWDMLYSLNRLYLIPGHLEKAVTTHPGQNEDLYRSESIYFKDPTKAGLYNGPFMISEWQAGQKMTLIKNPFFNSSPRLSAIEISFLPHWGDVENSLRSGKADMVAAPGLLPDLIARLLKVLEKVTPPFNILSGPSRIWEHVDLQLRNSSLKNPGVRKALAISLNLEALVKELWGPYAKPSRHYIHPQDPWFTPVSSPCQELSHNPEMARKLFREAGWTPDREGILRSSQGSSLSLLLLTSQDNPVRQKTMELLKTQWEKAGLEIKTRELPGTIFFQDVLRKGSFPDLALYAWKNTFPFIPEKNFSSKFIPDKNNGFHGQNLGAWINRQTDSLLQSLREEWTFSGQSRLSNAIKDQFCREVPSIPLYFRPHFTLLSRRLSNIQISGFDFPEPFHSEAWGFTDPK